MPLKRAEFQVRLPSARDSPAPKRRRPTPSALSTRSLPMPWMIWNSRPTTRRTPRIIRPWGEIWRSPSNAVTNSETRLKASATPPSSGIVEEHDGKRRQQEDDRQHAVGHDALRGVAQILESHPPHGKIARRVAVQKLRRQPEQTIPESGFNPGCHAPLDTHQRHSPQDMQEPGKHADSGQRRRHRVERPGVAASIQPGPRRNRAPAPAPA